MRAASTLILVPLALAACPKSPPKAAAAGAPLAYPEAPRGDVVDDYFGTTVADPYRWMEDLDSAPVQAWVAAENTLTRHILDAVPSRAAIADRLSALWTYERWGLPTEAGDRVFFEYNDGTWDQPRVFVSDGWAGAPRLLLDPTALRADGTVSVPLWVPSDDGRFVAYGVADAGSDWQTWRVRDVATGLDLADELRWVKFSDCAWTRDHAGFFYSRFPEPIGEAMEQALAHQTLWFHRVGTPQSEDVLVHEDPAHPTWGFTGAVSKDGRHLIVTVSEGTEEKYRIYDYDMASLNLAQRGGRAGGALRKPLDAFDASYTFVGNDGDVAYILTDKDAPRYRLIAVDLARPEPSAWRTVLPETADTLTGVTYVGGRLIANRLSAARSVVTVHDTQGALLHTLDLPGLGTAGGFQGDPAKPGTTFGFASFTRPYTIYRLDATTGATTLWQEPKVDFDPDAYETTQVTYPSKDGTQVPMFLVTRRGVTRTGDLPTLLYGYGGFNIPITPGFKVENLMWLELGGVLAVANLRGGGEFGRAWHEAGTQLHKQNVFDDFIAGAEYLQREGWTRPDRLAIYGRSNGGLLVGAAVTQRPDLFGAAVPSVGVQDMLRYHRFTIGWAWASDYGTSEQSPEMFAALRAYSPVHNTRPGTRYPAILVTTGDHDDRVVPPHSYKFAAALQHDQAGDAPVLIRVETRAGHGAGTPVSLLVAEIADRYAFIARAFGWTPSVPSATAR
jgi:prolyl oligopeptidase